MESGLVERLERQQPRGDLGHVLQRPDGQGVADLPEQAGGEACAEQHEDRDPVRGRREEDRAEERHGGDHDHREHQSDAGAGALVRPPVAREAGDEHGARVDQRDVQRAHRGRAREAPEKKARPANRTDDERLEQPALGVPAHRSERQEDRQHRAEEEDREHGESEERGAGEDTVVDLVVGSERINLVEGQDAAEPVQREEADRQEENDEDHAPAHRLAERVAGHDQRAAHAAPTASR